MQNWSDADLMQLVMQKHRPALEELYDRYIKLVYSFSFKATQDEQHARAIVQAVFTRLWTSESGFNAEKGQFVNWLITITRNITIDHLRKEKRNQRYIPVSSEHWEHIPDNPANNPADVISRKLMREQMEKAYRHLSKSQVELIQSLYWEGYSLSEIAQMRNEPLGTIKSRLHQTLKILRNHLIPEMEG
ncbi:RNA polymerase sigma factor [Brevibacillus choshinensis]|uniref:RNA polymerase sigma factor n=1 Tax=Brevibacillus choshinensis TaxID=54911 RepID=UPI002E218229|nr:sigma-70 family RNA polymerase sigma factor [Brevibacillus choshinensis]MED4583684.1 sigma-70 family RNA polymerase sigma factor [Brevibacillus choshinensis]MED4751608.1 sigma-70 family RNA polymerase sigma factor [Brevibacillus choshinensis]MED4780155.1 sigma-70 family RNA polymerase sigma factor [Brevibacillus choshinensis]